MYVVSLDSLVNESYFTKVKLANRAYNTVKGYFTQRVGEQGADDFLDAFVMQFLSSDGVLSNTEVNFYDDLALKSYKQETLAARYKSLKADNVVMKMRGVVDRSPEEVKDAVILLAALCLVCDKEITASERADYEAFIKIISENDK